MANLGAAVSAVCALTAVLAKVGVQDINSDFATFIRTIVVLVAIRGTLFFGKKLLIRNWVRIVIIAADVVLVALKP